MTDTIVSMTTYFVVALICYGIAYLFSVEPHAVVAYVALAAAVDAQVRVGK